MENNKWKMISAVLAIALILTISYSLWKKHMIEKELLNEFVLNVSAYAQYALPAIEEFEKTRDQNAFAERMDEIKDPFLISTYHYSYGTIGDISPDVAYYNQKIVDPLYFGLGFNVRNARNGVIGKSDLEQIKVYKKVLRDHHNYVRSNTKRSISEMKKQLDAEVEALN